MQSRTLRQFHFVFSERDLEGIVHDLRLLERKQMADKVTPKLSEGSKALLEHYEGHMNGQQEVND